MTARAKELFAVNVSERVLQARVPADNRTIFFLKLSTESDIWMVQLGGGK